MKESSGLFGCRESLETKRIFSFFFSFLFLFFGKPKRLQLSFDSGCVELVKFEFFSYQF